MKFILNEKFILTEADSSVDWKQIYNNIKTPEEREAFWDGKPGMASPLDVGYYKTEWGNLSQKIKDLGIAFINTLTKVGWNEVVNPFIAFIKAKESLLKSGKLNKETFTYIYNAVANNLLTTNDLKGGGTFKEYNIIFNDKLYELGGSIQEYLKLQNTIKENASRNKFIDDILLVKYNSNKGLAMANIMYTEGNSETLEASIQPGQGTFRSISSIEQILATIMPESNEDDEKPQITSKEIDKIVNGLTADNSKIMLAYLAFVWSLDNTAELNTIDKEFNGDLYKNMDAVKNKLTKSVIDDCKKIISQREFAAKDMKDLLAKLMEKAGFKK